jgi:small subunit ribosomal protein S13
MPRVIGIDIPDNKRLEISLTYIYGIGRKISKQIIENLKLDPNMRCGNLTSEDIAKLNSILQSDEYEVEGDLRREVQNNIKRMVNIQCYRGLRHRMGLPVRGQRTKTNARTRKGKKKKTIPNKKI